MNLNFSYIILYGLIYFLSRYEQPISLPSKMMGKQSKLSQKNSKCLVYFAKIVKTPCLDGIPIIRGNIRLHKCFVFLTPWRHIVSKKLINSWIKRNGKWLGLRKLKNHLIKNPFLLGFTQNLQLISKINESYCVIRIRFEMVGFNYLHQKLFCPNGIWTSKTLMDWESND